MAKDAPADVEHVDPCCDDCRQKMEKEPHNARLFKEACLFETKLTPEMLAGDLTWD